MQEQEQQERKQEQEREQEQGQELVHDVLQASTVEERPIVVGD